QRLLAEALHDALGRLGADALDQAGAEVTADAVCRAGQLRLEGLDFEVTPVSRMDLPLSAQRQRLADVDAGHRADDGGEILRRAIARARLGQLKARYRPVVLVVLVDDALDRPGKVLHVCLLTAAA